VVSLEKVPRDSIACGELSVLAQGAAAIRLANNKALSIAKYLRLLAFDKRLKLIHMGIKATAAEAVAEVEVAAQSGEIKRLATEFMALSGSALTVSLAQEAEPGDPLRAQWHAHSLLLEPELSATTRAEISSARGEADAAESAAVDAALAAAAAATASEAAAALKAAAAANEVAANAFAASSPRARLWKGLTAARVSWPTTKRT
jgi:hypothetical protein